MADTETGAVSPTHAGDTAATPERLSSPAVDTKTRDSDDDEDDNVGKPRSKTKSRKDGEDEGEASEEEELLSDVDEDQLEDYDPATAYIEERPITIDEEAARGLKATKRKRDDKAAPGTAVRKPKEGRREKKRRPAASGKASGSAASRTGSAKAAGGDRDNNNNDDDDDDEDMADDNAVADGAAGKRARKVRPEASRRKKSPSPEVNEEDLTPEERRKRALNRAIDLAIRNPNKRRRKQDEDDLEKMADEEIAQLKIRMEKACMADIEARDAKRPAVSKLQLLPQVLSVLNRSDIRETVLDPETNFLQSVKFFLEPLNDGSLPSYAIQRDIFTCLTQLPIEKDALLSSGIGKVVLFYTRSKRAELTIKRMAERLVGEWSRPILKKTDDYKKRYVETRDYDYLAAKAAEQGGGANMSSQYTLTERPMSRFELDKEVQLAPPVVNPNRAIPVGLPQSYSIAPNSTFDGHRGNDFRPIGASSVEAFRRMAQRSKMRNKKK